VILLSYLKSDLGRLQRVALCWYGNVQSA